MHAEIDAVKAAIIAVREANSLVNNTRPLHTIPKSLIDQ